ncbi:MAG: regulatory protein RecX [Acidobacteriota bacterium]|nr:regulatory protein RecX [Acidobacteriota bacterium]
MPDRRGRALGAQGPRATLVIWPGEDREERITVPLAVGRALRARRKRDQGRGGPASRAEFLHVVGEVARGCAAARIERLIDRREYSRQGICQKLRRDGYAASVIDLCVSRACETGLVSDSRYADSYIRSKVAAGWGMPRIERGLAQGGIDTSQLDGWPYDYLDPDEELARATRLAMAKRMGGSRPFERLVRHLCSRGFALGVAMQAARQAMDAQHEGCVVDF